MPTKTKVKELMTTDIIKFQPDDKIRFITETFQKRKISGAPVVDNQNKVVGVISEADIINLTATIPLPEIDLDPFNPLSMVLTFSYRIKIKKIPEEIKKQCKTLFDGSAADIMSKNPLTITSDDSISDAARLMHKKDFNRLPVVDDKGRLVGIITRDDVISVLVK